MPPFEVREGAETSGVGYAVTKGAWASWGPCRCAMEGGYVCCILKSAADFVPDMGFLCRDCREYIETGGWDISRELYVEEFDLEAVQRAVEGGDKPGLLEVWVRSCWEVWVLGNVTDIVIENSVGVPCVLDYVVRLS